MSNKEKTGKLSGDQDVSALPEVDDFVVEFRKYTTQLTRKFLDRKGWEPKDDSKILSFIPGTITRIDVKEGDVIEEGQALMVLEAMKMKNVVHAERGGKIIAINAKVGDKVPKNHVIFELELA